MIRVRQLLRFVPVVVVLAVAAPAGAARPLDEAKALTAAASVKYKLGRFSEALDGYTKAYEKYPIPGLLFNIAQCDKMLKNYEQAIQLLNKGYLRDKPAASNRTDVETLIADSQRALEAQRAEAEAQKRAEAEAQRRADAEAQRRAAEEQARAHAPPQVAPNPPAEETRSSSPAVRVAGVALGVAGVALVGTGVYFGLIASSDSSTVAQLAAQRANWSSHDQLVYNEGSGAARTADVLYVVGGTAVAAGALFAFLGWRKVPVLSIVPVREGIGWTGASLLLHGSF